MSISLYRARAQVQPDDVFEILGGESPSSRALVRARNGGFCIVLSTSTRFVYRRGSLCLGRKIDREKEHRSSAREPHRYSSFCSRRVILAVISP